MYKVFLFCFLILIGLSGCKKTTQTVTTEIKKNDNNKITTHKTYGIANVTSLKQIELWKEYTVFNEFFKRFEKISPTEAFDNITELKELTVALEDSLNIKTFKTPSFKSRLHVLENEVLRLTDMAVIPAITSKEVNAQIDKVFLVFGSLNDKINTALNQEKFEKEIHLDNFFTMDTKELVEKKEPRKLKIPKKKQKRKPIKKALKSRE